MWRSAQDAHKEGEVEILTTDVCGDVPKEWSSHHGITLVRHVYDCGDMAVTSTQVSCSSQAASSNLHLDTLKILPKIAYAAMLTARRRAQR